MLSWLIPSGFHEPIIADSGEKYGMYEWSVVRIATEIGSLQATPFMEVLTFVLVLIAFSLAGLQLWRWLDDRRATAVWKILARSQRQPATHFHPSMVAALPEPARRYFLFTIRSGAQIQTVSEISTVGQIGLGTKDKPNYLPMSAEQILAPAAGLVWKLRAGDGLIRISGSDGFSRDIAWTRFWLMNAIPIVRAGGTDDYARAAYGRVVAEAVFWAPAALLPSDSVAWEARDANTARATVTCGDLTQTVDITVADDGRPTAVVIPRWSNANPAKAWRVQPFGGYLSEFCEFDGYRLPTAVEGGNFIGTDDYFPFYKVSVTGIRFCPAPGT
jgi:hypothetical protein